MPFQLFNNNALSTLSVAVSSNTQASLTLQTGHGARFPSPTGADYFLVTLDDGTNVEVCRCVSRATDVLTVLRGQEGTTAQASFATTTTKVQLRATSEGLNWLSDKVNFTDSWIRAGMSINSWSVMGMAPPTLVGSHAAQTLTNSSLLQAQARQRVTVGSSVQFKVELRSPVADVSGQRGFRFSTRFGIWNLPNSSHFFLGLVGTTGTVNSVHPPTSLQNAFVIGHSGSGTPGNLSLYRVNSSNVVTALDLGSYFTTNTVALYEFQVNVAPGDANWYYVVKRLDISSIADASSFFSTTLPDNSLWLSPMLHGASMVTSGLGIDLCGWSVERG